jgi:low molecular weight protein-tyrosine phosphatase
MPDTVPPTVLFLCTGNYFRSRFAEELFNRVAADQGLPMRARSGGLEERCHLRNPGPISPHTAAGLRARGMALGAAPRSPRDVTAEDLDGAAMIIALKEAEHRPLVQERFPRWAGQVRYWDVDDLPLLPPGDVLAKIEGLVRSLVGELAAKPLPP